MTVALINGCLFGKLPAAVGEVKPTTATLSAVDSTASRASADVIGPKQNNRKSLASQNKKTNKRG